MATVSVVSKVKSDTDDGYITLGAYNYFGTWYSSNTYSYFDSGQVTNKGGCSAYTMMGVVSCPGRCTSGRSYNECQA